MVWPLRSLLHKGVTVVPQFWQAMTTVESSLCERVCVLVRSVACSSMFSGDFLAPSEGEPLPRHPPF